MRDKRRHLAAAGTLLACAFVVYGGTLPFQLVWDDRLILNALRTPPGASVVRHLISAPLLPDTSYYRPLVLASFKTDALLAPLFPWSFHFTNVLLHGLVSVLFYAFAVTLGISSLAALLAGLLFAATPLHLESVAFVSGRTDLWAALFVLAAAIAWQTGRRSPAVPIRAVAICSGAYLLAGLSKETAFVLPAVLLAWRFLDPGDAGSGNEWKDEMPWILGWSLALAGAVAVRLGVAHLGAPRGVSQTPAEMLELWTAYSRLLVLPWPLRTYYTSATLPAGAANLLAALVLPAAALGTRYIGNSRAGLRSLLWVAAFLLPAAGLVRPEGAVLATRFAYIPSLGVALLAAYYLDALAARQRIRAPALGMALLLVVGMGAAVWKGIPPWRSNETLYEAMYRDAPEAPVVNFNMGNLRRSAGRLTEAEGLYRRTLGFDPRYRDAALNLGITLDALGRDAEAEEAYRQLLRQGPEDARVYVNLGNLLFKRNRWAESESCYRRAAELAPREPRAHFSLGLSLEKLGRPAEAAGAFRRALELQPDMDAARRHLLALEPPPAGLR